MKRLLIALAIGLLAGCSQPEPVRYERVIDEARMRAYTDEVLNWSRANGDPITQMLANNADRTGGMYGSRPYREQAEEIGRNICSHLIAGKSPNDAMKAAYRAEDPTTPKNQAYIRAADQILCPLRPAS